MTRRGIQGLFGASIVAIASTTALADGTLHKLQIETASGSHVFKVALAKTEPEREKGLMYRRSMPKDQGMLFEYEREEPVIFWMKNTYLRLDMIFIDHAGRVVGIKHDAKPMDETLIPSEAPSTGVLELNAGVAAAIGAKIGDAVRYSAPATSGK